MNITYIINPNLKGDNHQAESAYYIAKALENKGCKITYLTLPLRTYGILTTFKLLLNRKKYLGSNIASNELYARKQASILSQLIRVNTDIIFSTNIDPIAFLDTNIPIVIYTNSSLPGENYMEQRATINSDLSIFSTELSAKNAIRNYKIDPGKIAVVPYGANIEEPVTAQKIDTVIEGRSKDILRLLFFANEWNKSGETALAIAESLNQRGIATELHVAGVKKGLPPTSSYITKHEIWDINNHKVDELLIQLYKNSHFLIVPRPNDCPPELITKASAFGLPVLTTDTAGTSTIVKNDLNGKLFEENASPEEFAKYIADVILNINVYDSLCLSSFNEYQNRLNWDTTAIKIIGLLEKVKLVHELWTF